MEYGKLQKIGSAPTPHAQPMLKKSKLNVLLIVSAALLVVCAVSVAIAFIIKKRGGGGVASLHNRRPSQAMSTTTRGRSAHEDCLELLDDSTDLLARSLASVAPGEEPTGSTEDVLTWLSAALTNHDTCAEGFDEVSDGSGVKSNMSGRVKDLSEIVTNSLAMYAASSSDVGDVSIQNRRRRMLDFPIWVNRRERALLDMPASALNADVVVSKDDRNGTYKTIAEAIKKVPEKSDRRFIIHVMAGR